MQLNGNLTLNPLGASQVENVIIERVSSLPTAVSSERGRVVFLTSGVGTYYFNQTGTAWQAFATGGNATTLATDLSNLETSIGAIVNSDGTYNSLAFGSTSYLTHAASITNALTILDSQIHTNDALADLLDVNLTSTCR